MTGHFIAGGDSAHSCLVPEWKSERHTQDTDTSVRGYVSAIQEWNDRETANLEWSSLAFFKRIFTPRPPMSGTYPSARQVEHYCREACFRVAPGSLWSCDECHMVYILRQVHPTGKGQWVKATEEAHSIGRVSPTKRTAKSSGDSRLIVGIALGGLVL